MPVLRLPTITADRLPLRTIFVEMLDGSRLPTLFTGLALDGWQCDERRPTQHFSQDAEHAGREMMLAIVHISS
jgi:hypothetical protein